MTIMQLSHAQVGNWVTNSILQYEDLDERVAAVQQLIIIAKVGPYCGL